MKFTFKPSPNYRTEQTTTGIMIDLTVCLLAVALFSTAYYSIKYGFGTGMRVILMLAAAVGTALATEAVYFKVTGAKNVVREVSRSYGWVTAIIMVLITRLDVSIYAIIISTILCIVFGKLVFGGFGQNIFNPAAFGEAIIMNSFAASKAASVTADVYTGATPMTAMNSYGWVMENSAFSDFIGQFGGLGNMLIGNYPAVIGGTCAVLILLCGAYLMWRKDIDWHMTCTYIVCIFVFSLITGLIHGEGLWFAVYNLIGGGTLFLAVFMLTDPVTSPMTIPGRVIFAVGTAALTLIIRWKANLPDGALYSLLLMNMLTPAIDRMIPGNQIKEAGAILKKVLITTGIISLITIGVGAILKGNAPAAPAEPAAEPAAAETGGKALKDEDFTANNVEISEVSNDGTTAVYAVKAKGFEGVNEANVTVDLGSKTVSSIEITTFSDTPGVGDMATAEAELARYAGAGLDSSIDSTSGASFTSASLRAMVKAALEAAGE